MIKLEFEDDRNIFLSENDTWIGDPLLARVANNLTKRVIKNSSPSDGDLEFLIVQKLMKILNPKKITNTNVDTDVIPVIH